VLNRIKACQWD